MVSMRSLNRVFAVLIIVVLSLLTMQVAQATLPAPFEPYRVVLDNDGNVYVLAAGNESVIDYIHVYASDGREIQTISEGQDRRVDDIAFDSVGNRYLRDNAIGINRTLPHIIRKITINGDESTVASVSESDHSVINTFAAGRDGSVYFNQWFWKEGDSPGDQQANKTGYIIKADPNGTLSVSYAENGSYGFGCLAVNDNGTIYAAKYDNITAIAPDGTVSTFWSLNPRESWINMISDVSIGEDGYVYVIEANNTSGGGGRVDKVSPNGTLISRWEGCGPHRFLGPVSVAADEKGKVFVADHVNQRIVWFTSDYRFGNDTSRNRMGEGILWGTIVQGYDYVTWNRMTEQEGWLNQLPTIGFFLGILLATGILGYSPIRFYRSGKSLSTTGNAVVVGIFMIIFIAVIFAVVVLQSWMIITWLFGNDHMGPIDYYGSVATSVQLLGLIVAIPLLAGSMVVYVSRSRIRQDNQALVASFNTGIVGLCLLCLCALIIAIGQPFYDYGTGAGLQYTLSHIQETGWKAVEIIGYTLALPALFIIPAVVFGGFLCWRSLAPQESANLQRGQHVTIIGIALIGSIILALVAIRISAVYTPALVVTVAFSLPLLLMLPLAAVSLKSIYRKGTLPLIIVIQVLSIVAIVFMPMVEIVLAKLVGWI